MYYLGWMYWRGTEDGIPLDRNKAVNWWRQAAERNCRDSQKTSDKLLVEGTLIREQDYLKEDKAEKQE